jgi:hypothetical protein
MALNTLFRQAMQAVRQHRETGALMKQLSPTNRDRVRRCLEEGSVTVWPHKDGGFFACGESRQNGYYELSRDGNGRTVYSLGRHAPSPIRLSQ